jgi:16S rRNA (uracil1498-N3)-methyltransferase
MPRIFIPHIDTAQDIVSIEGEKAHYIFSVLRCSPGDTLFITDDQGITWSAEISSISKRAALVKITGTLDIHAESGLDLVLLQGLLKGGKMDLVIQKATELGVKRIVPLISERSQIRETRKVGRWEKIAEEASRQCGRNLTPSVAEPAEFGAALQRYCAPEAQGVILWEDGGKPFSSCLKALSSEKQVLLCIGPEGGFSSKEVIFASENGFIVSSLGKRILRAETASIAALSIIQFVLGDLCGSDS